VQLRVRLLALINGKLLPKGSSLQAEIVARYQESSQVRQRREQERNHSSDATELDDGRFEPLLNLSILCTDDILMTHSRSSESQKTPWVFSPVRVTRGVLSIRACVNVSAALIVIGPINSTTGPLKVDRVLGSTTTGSRGV
jgi:hypothetical protein